MAYRNSQSQSFHDQVIQIAADNLRRTGNFIVYTNPDGQHNTKIGELYPDIILTPQNSNTVQFIIEVETADSVNASEAINQWKSYSTLGVTFYLLIPSSSRALAESICRQYGIQVKFATFWIDNNSQLIINYE